MIPSNPSSSSLASDVTSLSTTSAAKQLASRASFSSLSRVASVPDPSLAIEQVRLYLHPGHPCNTELRHLHTSSSGIDMTS